MEGAFKMLKQLGTANNKGLSKDLSTPSASVTDPTAKAAALAAIKYTTDTVSALKLFKIADGDDTSTVKGLMRIAFRPSTDNGSSVMVITDEMTKEFVAAVNAVAFPVFQYDPSEQLHPDDAEINAANHEALKYSSIFAYFHVFHSELKYTVRHGDFAYTLSQ